MGYIGEKIVGQELEKGRSLGYFVFHDIIDRKKKFNIDHVAIGPAGIIIVETKTKPKPPKGEPKIIYNGSTLRFPDKSYTSDPLVQVDRNAKAIQNIIHKLISEKKNHVSFFNKKNPVHVVRIVVYPGWFIDFKKAVSNNAVTKVTNDTILINVIKKMPEKLTRSVVSELHELFEEYLREDNLGIIDY